MASKKDRGRDEPDLVDPRQVARQLSISVRHAERLAAEGAFGPRYKIGYRTMRVQQSGVDAFLRRAERENE
jgi:hypothetical protein